MKRKVVLGVVLGIVAALLPFSTFQSASVCSRCGCRSSAIDFQLPMIPLTYWRHRTTEQTPFSIVVGDLALCEPHSHEWKLIQGGGNGILCALGSGGNLNRNVRSKEVAAFIKDTNRYRGKPEALTWLKTALDDRDSKAFGDWLQSKSFPENGHPLRTDYEEWRERADKEWPEFVEYSRRLFPR
jgi:hypothetical protein